MKHVICMGVLLIVRSKSEPKCLHVYKGRIPEGAPPFVQYEDPWCGVTMLNWVPLNKLFSEMMEYFLTYFVKI
jgi:hypothetical protein